MGILKFRIWILKSSWKKFDSSSFLNFESYNFLQLKFHDWLNFKHHWSNFLNLTSCVLRDIDFLQKQFNKMFHFSIFRITQMNFIVLTTIPSWIHSRQWRYKIIGLTVWNIRSCRVGVTHRNKNKTRLAFKSENQRRYVHHVADGNHFGTLLNLVIMIKYHKNSLIFLSLSPQDSKIIPISK